jgi:hypothetical protein
VAHERSERPECEEPGDDLAAAVALPDDEALTPAAHPEDCTEPSAAPPALIDCNDARADIWVQEMIGSCAMPRALVGPARGERRETLSFSTSRGPERTPPLRGSAPSDPLPLLLHSSAAALDPDLSASPLVERAAMDPHARARDRIERPPRT